MGKVAKYTPQSGDKNYDMLSDNSDYWLTATKEEVKKYLEENFCIKDYNKKKKQILCKIQNKIKYSRQ